MEEITLNNGGSNPGVKGFKGNTLQQLPVVDWLADLPETQLDTDLVATRQSSILQTHSAAQRRLTTRARSAWLPRY